MTTAGEGRVAAIQVSQGGVPKRPVESARVTRVGLEGDRQAHPSIHGGPERAVCLYSVEWVRALRAEGHPLPFGGIGENVLVEGVDWEKVEPGSRLRLGEVVLEIASYTNPCKSIRKAFEGEDFTRIRQELYPGWSRVCARVVAEGVLRVGDPVELVGP